MFKLKIDLVWNYISLVIMAVSGLLINTVIAAFYGSDALGIFNETYAWYMILSQLSVWGIHMAVVKYVPQTEDEKSKNSILWSGLVITVCISVLITSLSESIVLFLPNLQWQKSMVIAFSGLIFFSLNKVLLSYLNAIYKMVSYAVFSSIRYILLGSIVVVLSQNRIDPDMLTMTFPLTEIFVLILVLVYFFASVKPEIHFDKKDAKELLRFGTSILPSYMVIELNTKVDVVCLGLLLTDISQIGIYSFAILFTDGFYNLYIVLRKIINPHLSKANADGNLSEKIILINGSSRKYFYLCGGVGYVLLAAAYYIVCLIFMGNEYKLGLIYILIISFAIVINGKSIVYGDLLGQVGLPLEESLLNIITVISNAILNVVLILLFGTIGAAIATAISYFLFALYMRIRVKKHLDIII